MTKEDFIGELFEYDGDYARKFVADLAEKFFESNVCIPKGETLQVNFAGGWDDVITINHHCEYRIKPSEPIYEYKWIVGCIYGIDAITDQYHTEEELEGIPFRKIEETKRERK